jgi:hypothetical protein
MPLLPFTESNVWVAVITNNYTTTFLQELLLFN